MTAEAMARDTVRDFSWNVGRPDMTKEEANLLDLAILKKELEDLIAMRAHDAVHDHGLTWDQVGRVLNMSPEDAAKKFDNPQ